jgi:putative tryptophan/tyrosine transport system substrate-binding protein
MRFHQWKRRELMPTRFDQFINLMILANPLSCRDSWPGAGMQLGRLRRRAVITLIGGAAAAWPLAAHSQPAIPVIGLLNGTTTAASQDQLGAFRQGLGEAGLVEGRNLAIVYRSAEGDVTRLSALAAELVRIPVAVIAAVGGDSSVHSAKAATATIPIVFTTASDPVEAGMVASLNRPGGNVTGATSLQNYVVGKQVGQMRDLVPKLTAVGFLTSPFVPMTAASTRDFQSAAAAVGLKTVVLNVSDEVDIESAFAQFSEQRVGALIVSSGTFFNRHLDRIVALTARHAIPAIFSGRQFAAAGGLMSYSAENRDTYRQAGLYVARILRGDKPADLPVMLPTKFNLVINLKTAKTLGIEVPDKLLALADEVIE